MIACNYIWISKIKVCSWSNSWNEEVYGMRCCWVFKWDEYTFLVWNSDWLDILWKYGKIFENERLSNVKCGGVFHLFCQLPSWISAVTKFEKKTPTITYKINMHVITAVQVSQFEMQHGYSQIIWNAHIGQTKSVTIKAIEKQSSKFAHVVISNTLPASESLTGLRDVVTDTIYMYI